MDVNSPGTPVFCHPAAAETYASIVMLAGGCYQQVSLSRRCRIHRQGEARPP